MHLSDIAHYCFFVCCVQQTVTAHALSKNAVQTTNGLLIGHGAGKLPDVIEYLGIPYAQPPLGKLRFAAPKPSESSPNQTLEARNYSASCLVPPSSPLKYPNSTAQFPRIAAAFTGAIDRNRNEDCLTLNIWGKNTSLKDKPVIVFFYGGRFTTGSSNTPFYNGAYLANHEDVVIVTVNFRVNIFGFPGASNNTQNLGLLDQRLALEWIRTNIHAFGGSPSRIVISGQSSGAVAVDYWSYTYKDDPIVSGYIETSGNAFSFGMNSQDVATRNWETVTAALGCAPQGEESLACMRRIENISAIEEATLKVRPPPGFDPARVPPPFQPVADNVTGFEDYGARLAAGNFSRLPFLVGHNTNEAGYYKIPAFNANITLPASTWSNFNTQSFLCPVAYAANGRNKYSVPTYRYIYDGDWENLRLYPGSEAYHGTEVEMVLGVSEDVSGIPDSEEEKKMTEVFMKAWGAFARDPIDGLTRQLGWPRYGEGEGQGIVKLGFGNKGEATFAKVGEIDEVCKNFTVGG